jgi:Anti-sigma factor NepR
MNSLLAPHLFYIFRNPTQDRHVKFHRKVSIGNKVSGDMSGKTRMDEKSKGAKPARPRATSLAVTREIDENLKRVYQAALTDDVPDRFTRLLAQLREKEGKQ